MTNAFQNSESSQVVSFKIFRSLTNEPVALFAICKRAILAVVINIAVRRCEPFYV